MRQAIKAVFICVAIAACAAAFAGDVAIRVFVDDRKIELDPPAIVRDGTAYVGLRGVADALGATTKWDDETKTAMITLNNKRTRVAQSDGIMVDGHLLLPLRAISEAVDCTVEWDSDEKAVKITTEVPCSTGGG